MTGQAAKRTQGLYGIIGTAGHVDHGKTTLVQALTGRWLDRLPQEKTRGMTISLGFTQYHTLSGMQAGIVDVPGHEGLVRTMIRGAASMDLVLFLIDGSEGIRPQSREHLLVLSVLGVRAGIVVLTKADRVPEADKEAVARTIRDGLAGSFLADQPVVWVSAQTGEGMARLEQVLDEQLCRCLAGRRSGSCQQAGQGRGDGEESFPYLSVDQVFSVLGAGPVVTGTLRGAAIARGQKMWLYPRGGSCSVRGLQVHSGDVSQAEPGYRVAVNLSRVEKANLHIGQTLAGKKDLPLTRLCRVRLYEAGSEAGNLGTAAESERKGMYRAGARYHFLCRTDFATCRLRFDRTGEAVLYMDRPILLFPEDRFVLRTYSPVETIGGGVVTAIEAGGETKGSKRSPLRRAEKNEADQLEEHCKEQLAAMEKERQKDGMGMPRSSLSEGKGAAAFCPGACLPDCFIPQESLVEEICGCLLQSGYAKRAQGTDKKSLAKQVQHALSRLCRAGRLYRIPEGYYVLAGEAKRIFEALRGIGGERVTMLDIKAHFGCTRKYARLLFSLTDQAGVTKKMAGESERSLIV